MPQQPADSVPYPFPVRKGLTLQRMVKLAKDPAFLADCEYYTVDFLRRLKGRTVVPTPTGLAFGRGSREDIMAFAAKWGVRPMFSPRFVRLVVQVATDRDRWGLIPVFPWTNRQEVLSRLEEIQKAIGKTHKDFPGTLFRDELIRWIKAHCRPNGKPWTWAEVGAAVLGENRLSFREEQRLMREYKRQGDSYRGAERKIHRLTNQWTPGDTAKKAMQRLETSYTWRPRTPGPRWADPLTPRLIELVEQADTADLETLRAKLKDLGTLLVELSLPTHKAGT